MATFWGYELRKGNADEIRNVNSVAFGEYHLHGPRGAHYSSVRKNNTVQFYNANTLRGAAFREPVPVEVLEAAALAN